MNYLKSFSLLFFATSIVAFNWNCKTLSNAGSAVGNALLPDVSADATLGKQTSDEIAKDPKTYPLLPERGNEEVYSYIRGIKNKLLGINPNALDQRTEPKRKIIRNKKI